MRPRGMWEVYLLRESGFGLAQAVSTEHAGCVSLISEPRMAETVDEKRIDPTRHQHRSREDGSRRACGAECGGLGVGERYPGPAHKHLHAKPSIQGSYTGGALFDAPRGRVQSRRGLATANMVKGLSMLEIGFLFAVDQGNGFGLNGGMPWPKHKGDLARFKDLTMGCTVLAGTNTIKTLPPLPGRHVLTLSRKPDPWGFQVVTSLTEAIDKACLKGTPKLWIIGGAKVIQSLISDERITKAEVTLMDGIFSAHVRLPFADLFHVTTGWHIVGNTPGHHCCYRTFMRGEVIDLEEMRREAANNV